jgi:hypothetical protein
LIDIDNLHQLIEKMDRGEKLPRSSGRTLANLVQAVQSADIVRDEPPTTFVVVTQHRPMALDCWYRAQDIARSLDIDFNGRTAELMFGNAKILFTTIQRLQNDLRGIRLANYFIDHYTHLSNDDHIFIENRLDN